MAKEFNYFVEDRDVRTTWIAFFTQWVLWGVFYVFRKAFDNNGKKVQDPEKAATTGNEKSCMGFLSGDMNLERRLANGSCVLAENTFMLLCVLVINTFGTGSTRAVMIITWIYFAFTVVFAIVDMLYENRFVRLGYSTLFYGLALAIGGLGYSQGW